MANRFSSKLIRIRCNRSLASWLLLALLVCCTSSVLAGPEFQVNTFINNSQSCPSMAMNSTGHFVIAWSSYDQDGSSYGIYAQRYDANGARVGEEFRVNTYTTRDQGVSSVAMNSAGHFVIAWSSYDQDGSSYGIYAQRYDANGARVGEEFRVNTYTNSYQSFPTVAMDISGNFVIAWMSDGQDGSGEGVYAQRYNSSGEEVGTEFQVNTYTNSDQCYPSVAMDSTGNFIISWMSNSQDGSGWGVYAQRYDTNGDEVGTEFRVNTYTNSYQSYSSLAMDSVGRFIIAWMSYEQDGSVYGIYAQRYDTNGAVVGTEFRVNTYTNYDQRYPSVTMDSAGRFVIAWSSNYQDGSGEGVYAQRFDSNGTAVGEEFRVNTYTNLNQEYPSVTMNSAGNFTIAWQSDGQDGSEWGIFAQSSNRRPVFQSTPVTTALLDTQYQYSITATDPDTQVSDLIISATSMPTWLNLTDHGNGSAILSGTPTAEDVGSHFVSLTASDGIDYTTQDFTIVVSSSNINTSTNFPDPNFRTAVEEFMGVAPDGEFTAAQAANKTGDLNCSNRNIGDLKGIEYLTGIVVLQCNNNQLTTLDLSHHLNLIQVDCSQNQITNLNLSDCPSLRSLECWKNRLTILDVTSCSQLGNLACYDNPLTQLDVIQNPVLGRLIMSNTQVATLDLHNNPLLTDLGCGNTPLTTLDVSANPQLKYLECPNTQITALDVSTNPFLQSLRCDNNQLSALNLSANTALTHLVCSANYQLTELNVSANTALTYLDCGGDPLEVLDVLTNTALTYLNCQRNQLTTLNVLSNTELIDLICRDNQLEDISTLVPLIHLARVDLRGNNLNEGDWSDVNNLSQRLEDPTFNEWDEVVTGFAYSPQIYYQSYDFSTPNINTPENFPDDNFRSCVEDFMGVPHGWAFTATMAAAKTNFLDCSNRNISDLKGIEYLTGIVNLYCNNNQLTNLDLSGNTALTGLYCYDNQLTSLDVSGCTTLGGMWCYNNRLTELNLAENAALVELKCDNNLLSNIDVTTNTQLIHLYCGNNLLTSINVSANTNLKSIGCYGNQLSVLNVSSHPSLEVLSCNDNQLTSLSLSDCPALWQLFCYNNQLSILDLTGCSALLQMGCLNNNLVELNTSDCAALTHLWCDNNQIESLDLSQNPQLMGLWCASNNLLNLDLSHNPGLMYLSCRGNRLSQLDVSHNPLLYSLEGESNLLTSLNLQIPDIAGTLLYSNNFDNPNNTNPSQAWTEWVDRTTSSPVAAQNGRIEWTGTGDHFLRLNRALPVVFTVEFDFFYQSGLATSGRFSLWPLNGDNPWGDDWSHNQYFLRDNTHFFNGADTPPSEGSADLSLPLGEAPHRIRLEVNNDYMVLSYKNRGQGNFIKIDERDFAPYGSGARYLQLGFYLDAQPEGLVYIDNLEIRNGDNLQILKCQNNQLSQLDLSSFPALHTLDCSQNQLTALDISHNQELNYLWCMINQIAELNVTGNPNLEILDFQANPIAAINVSQNPVLQVLSLSNTLLTELDISNNPTLQDLYSDNTQFTTLDLSHNPVLRLLFCSGNRLESIVFPSSASLERIRCERNHLQDSSTFLGLTNLIWLDLRDNDLDDGDWNNIVTLRDRMEAPSFDGGGYLINGFAYSPQNHYDPYDFSSPNINTEENFPDPNFRAFVEDFVGVPHGYGFTAAMAAAKSGLMNCSNHNISNLKGFGLFTGITTLNASHNQISDMSSWVGSSNLGAGDVLFIRENSLDEGDRPDIEALQAQSVIVISDLSSSSNYGIFEQTADWRQCGNYKVDGSVQVQGEGDNAFYVLQGNGDDIWDNSDEGFFVYKELEGSFSIQGKVRWIDPGTNEWAKIGFMIRDNASNPSSCQFMTILNGINQISSTQWRSETNQMMNYFDLYTDQNVNVVDLGDGLWFRLTRIAELDYFYSEYSWDGQNWYYGYGKHLPWSDRVSYGLAITNHEDNEELATGLFQNVSIQPFSNPFALRTIAPQQLNGGEIVDVTINVRAATSGDIIVTEIPPANVNLLAIRNGGTLNNGTITWTLHPTEAGISTLTYQIQYPQTPSSFLWMGHVNSQLIVGDQTAIVNDAGAETNQFSFLTDSELYRGQEKEFTVALERPAGSTEAVIGYRVALAFDPNQFTYIEDSATQAGASTQSGWSALQVNSATPGRLLFTGASVNRPLAGSATLLQFTLRVNDALPDGAALALGFDPALTALNDAALAADLQGWSDTVLGPNHPPSFTPSGDVTVLEDSGSYHASWASDISAGPVYENTQSVQFLVSTSNPDLFAVLPAIGPSGALSYTLAANRNGSATITVALQDNGGTAHGGLDTSAPHQFLLSVTPVNDAPSFQPGADVTVGEDSGAQGLPWAAAEFVSAGPADEAGQTLGFEVTVGAPQLFSATPALTAAGVLSFTPAPDQFGVSPVTAVLRDNGGVADGGVDSSTPYTFLITILPVNDAPSFVPGPDVAVPEDALAQSVAWATPALVLAGPPNEASQTLVFQVSNDRNDLFSVPPALSPDGTLNFTPALNQNGSAAVTVVLQDDGGTAHGGLDASLPHTFTLSMLPVNDAPFFIAGASAVAVLNSDGSPQVFPHWATGISAGPPDEASQSLFFSVLADRAELFAASPTINPGGDLSFTPQANAHGIVNATVFLYDSGGTLNGGFNRSFGPQPLRIKIYIPFLWGDLNGSGGVGAVDASYLLQYNIGLIETFPGYPVAQYPEYYPDPATPWLNFPPAADVTDDGIAGTLDAADILKQYIFLIEHFPADSNGDNYGPDRAVSAKRVQIRTAASERELRFRVQESDGLYVLTLAVDEGSQVRGLRVGLNYDPQALELQIEGMKCLPAGSLLVSNAQVPGCLMLAAALPQELEAGEQDLLKIPFRRVGTAAASLWVSLDLELTQLNDGLLPLSRDTRDAVDLLDPTAVLQWMLH